MTFLYNGTIANNLFNALSQSISDRISARGNDGNDTLIGASFNDTLLGGRGNDSLSAAGGVDLLVGEDGDDTLDGGDGDDTLDGGAGADLLRGGNGNDKLYGGSYSDRLYGDAGRDYLDGGTGNDTLQGGTDNDTLLGNVGNDTLSGEGGDDRLLGGSETDLLYGGIGNDYLHGGIGGDYLMGVDANYIGRVEYDVLAGGRGDNAAYDTNRDIFVLGKGSAQFYRGQGHANIKDYDITRDTLQFAISTRPTGSPRITGTNQVSYGNYQLTLGNYLGSNNLDAKITYNGSDLIAYVEDFLPSNFNINNLNIGGSAVQFV